VDEPVRTIRIGGAMTREIVRVQFRPGDVRRYDRKTAERLVARTRGAVILNDRRQPAAKAQEAPPAIKAMLAPPDTKGPAASGVLTVATPARRLTGAAKAAAERRAAREAQAAAAAEGEGGDSGRRGDAGILVVRLHKGMSVAPSLARRLGRGLAVASDLSGQPRELPFARTLWWDGRAQFRPDLARPGLALLRRWEVAAPLDDVDRLALELGSGEDRARASAVLGDLRVPVYDPRVLYLRRCEATTRLLDEWARQRGSIKEERLAFLCAVYLTQPKLCALPPTWIRGKRAAA
jgi:hypothetical protein